MRIKVKKGKCFLCKGQHFSEDKIISSDFFAPGEKGEEIAKYHVDGGWCEYIDLPVEEEEKKPSKKKKSK